MTTKTRRILGNQDFSWPVERVQKVRIKPFQKVALLNNILRKGAPTNHTCKKGAHGAVEELKQHPIEPPLRARPKNDQPFTIETNACNRPVERSCYNLIMAERMYV